MKERHTVQSHVSDHVMFHFECFGTVLAFEGSLSGMSSNVILHAVYRHKMKQILIENMCKESKRYIKGIR